MAFDKHPNLWASTVATAPSPASSGTTLTVAAGDAAKLLAQITLPCNATVGPANTDIVTFAQAAEIVRITANPSGDQLTITRYAEASYKGSARSIINTDVIFVGNSVKEMTDIERMGLFPTAVKTTAYNPAAAGDFVPCDTTGGAFTVTLPTAPTDGSRVAVALVKGANAVTVACGGSDVLDVAAGTTSATIPLLFQVESFQYNASSAIWYRISNRLPRSELLASFSGDATVTSAGVVTVPRLNNVNEIGTIAAIGHSWLAGGNVASVGTDWYTQNSILARLAAMLKIDTDNVLDHATAGSSMTSSVSATGAPAGWAAVLQFMYPNNATHVTANSGGVQSLVNVANPGAAIVVHGVNDWSLDHHGFSSVTPNVASGVTAWKHAMRLYLSRIRAGAMWCSKSPAGTMTWDSAFTFSAAWNNNVATIFATAAGYRYTATDSETLSFLLPADFSGGWVALCFIAQQNQRAALTGGITNVATTLTTGAPDNGAWPAAPFVMQIDAEGGNTREEVLVLSIAGNTVLNMTRAQNGTAASAHGVGAICTVATDTAYIDWSTSSSTTAAAHANTPLSGQGYAGNEVTVVARFNLPASDAGKTIVAKYRNLVAGDTAQKAKFDSAWLESLTPPLTAIVNLPRYPWGEFGYMADIAILNAATTSVVAEFTESPSQITIADIDSDLWKRGGVVYGTNGSTPGASGTGTTIGFTANDKATFDTLVAPFKMHLSDDTGSANSTVVNPEDILVTGITFVSGTQYTLTVVRGYNATSNVTHPAGAQIGYAAFINNDNIHPNAKGHAWIAKKIYDALGSITPITNSLANSVAETAGNWVQDETQPVLGVGDGFYITPQIAGANTATTASSPAVGALTFVPVFIPKPCTVIEIGCVVSTLNAGSTIALGIYDNDWTNQQPGNKVLDAGTISGGSAGLRTITNIAYPLRAGWVWLACLQTGTAAVIRQIPLDGLAWPMIPMTSATLSTTPRNIAGYVMSGQSSLPASASSLGQVTGALAAGNCIAYVYIRVRATQWA